MANYLTKEASLRNVEMFFRNAPSDTVAVEDVFIEALRDLANDKSNRSWLSNKLTAMKEYNLVIRHYSRVNGKRKLSRLSLTPEAKRLLGREEPSQQVITVGQPSSSSNVAQLDKVDVESLLESVNRNVEILQEKLPSFVITFNIRPRREMGATQAIGMRLKRL